MAAVSSRRSPVLRPKNRLLAALPDEDLHRLRPDIQTVPTKLKQVFHEQGQPIRHVYFPNGGLASITTVLGDGRMVEAATVGSEGMLGIEAFFGDAPVAPGQTMMQVPDTDAERLSVPAFRRELVRRGALHDLIGRYVQTTIKQSMQSAACNALHDVTERCPRWLLITHDRVGSDRFQLSQEFLSVMLGVRRQTVSVVAATLQRAGLITYKHGWVTVRDRPGLEAASCECYAAIVNHDAASRRTVR